MPVPLLDPRRIVEAEDEQGGRWIEVVDEGNALIATFGRTRTTVLGARRARRRSWRVVRVDGRVELLATWPVSELLTSRIGAVVAALDRELGDMGADAEREVEAVRVAASRLTETELPTLAGTLWRSAFPLLQPVVERHAELAAVPEVLDPLLRSESLRVGVRRVYGRVTRPLVRAVAERLLPADGGPPVFDPLVVATMAVGSCGPEQLTEIISTDPRVPGSVRFGIADVARARLALVGPAPRQVVALLRTALGEPDGPRHLADRLAQWNPPRPAPPPPLPAPPARPVRAAPAAPPAPPTPSRLTAPPRPAAVRIEHPVAWRRADGATVAGHTIVLPRTTDDLRYWGRLMDNCLGTFVHSVAIGRSRILGLSRGGRLRFAVEVTPGGMIRQIEGVGNTRPETDLGRRIARDLVGLGLADSDGRTGRSLIAPT